LASIHCSQKQTWSHLARIDAHKISNQNETIYTAQPILDEIRKPESKQMNSDFFLISQKKTQQIVSDYAYLSKNKSEIS